GPCISSRWGLWTFEVPLVPPVDCPSPRPYPREERGEGEEAPPVDCSSPRPSRSELRSSRPREERGEGEEAPARGEGEEEPPRIASPRFFSASAGRLAASPYFRTPA